jgi:ribosome-associated heat shock protein Hsp15
VGKCLMSKKSNANTNSDHADGLKVRLDKWLWAARFYKIVEVGANIKLAQGVDEKLITILSVLEKRQSAPIAQTMYQESDASIAKREENSIARKNNSFFAPHPDKKPDKKQRRELLKMKSS